MSYGWEWSDALNVVLPGAGAAVDVTKAAVQTVVDEGKQAVMTEVETKARAAATEGARDATISVLLVTGAAILAFVLLK